MLSASSDFDRITFCITDNNMLSTRFYYKSIVKKEKQEHFPSLEDAMKMLEVAMNDYKAKNFHEKADFEKNKNKKPESLLGKRKQAEDKKEEENKATKRIKISANSDQKVG